MEKLGNSKNIVEEAFNFCPGSAISDFYTALYLLSSALNGGYSNVLINLKWIKDEEFVKDILLKAKV